MITSYCVDENDSRLLLGPGGFECYLGEPEDCSWLRDGANVVDLLNRQHNAILKAIGVISKDIDIYKSLVAELAMFRGRYAN